MSRKPIALMVLFFALVILGFILVFIRPSYVSAPFRPSSYSHDGINKDYRNQRKVEFNNVINTNRQPASFCRDAEFDRLCRRVPGICDDNMEPCCHSESKPTVYTLDTGGRHNLTLEARRFHEIIVCAEGKNTMHYCHPWVDMQARVSANTSDKLQYSKYMYNFNSAEIVYNGNGSFSVILKPMEPGDYVLEVYVLYDQTYHSALYNQDVVLTKTIQCKPVHVLNSPVNINVVDSSQTPTPVTDLPLCRNDDDMTGRWVDVPATGCDGTVCEGNIDVLHSFNRVWAPYQCHLKIFDKDSIDKCIGKKSLLVLGDSVGGEIANEIIQAYYYADGILPTSAELKARNSLLMKPCSWVQIGEGLVGYSYIMGQLGGCGIGCIFEHGDEILRKNHNKSVDLMVSVSGAHDVVGLRNDSLKRSVRKWYKPDYDDVFEHYADLLPSYFTQLRKMMSPDGSLLLVTAPQCHSGCGFSAQATPRMRLINRILTRMGKFYGITVFDYFSITENCWCGSIHKGIQYFNRNSNRGKYDGYLSRMATHTVLNLLCN